MSATMIGPFTTPQEEGRSQYPLSHSRKDVQSESVPRHRKAASTGGGRAWTEDEESFLLRTRNNKMPYKHIAAHLQKTELACRLHYHQMTFSNNRRRRTCSTSSIRTTVSLIPNSDSCNIPEERSLQMVPGSSPPSTPKMAETSPGVTRTDSRRLHTHDSDDSISTHSSDNGMSGIQHPPPMELGKTLRLDTAFAMPSDVRRHRKQNIDFTRLHSIYAANRHAFWSSIASQYSADQYVSPSQLEQAFLEQKATSLLGASLLPTPNATPKISPEVSYSAPVLTAVEAYGFNAINRTPVVHTALSAPSPGRCAVSALLNEPLD